MTPHDWKDLLDTAAGILDGAGIAPEEWSFGGGTALAFRLNHRVSNDVDIFLTDAQLLLLVTPRLNGDVAAMVLRYGRVRPTLTRSTSSGLCTFPRVVCPRLQ